jgi:hypothetical protein
MDIDKQTWVTPVVCSGKLLAGRSSRSRSGNFQFCHIQSAVAPNALPHTYANGVRLSTASLLFGLLLPGKVKPNYLVSHYIDSRLNITWNRYRPRTVCCNEHVGTEGISFWVISSLVNLEEVYIIHRRILAGHISHVLREKY